MSDLESVAKQGDRLETLKKIRDHLAGELQHAASSSVAPIAKQLRETIAEIDQLAPKPQQDRADEVAKKRAKRRAAAANLEPPPESGEFSGSGSN